MNKETTSVRLRKIMEERNLRQVDILNLTKPYCSEYGVKMNKSDLSQYCSGKTEPNQEKLFILGKALNVSEAWLMGFDVPMERTNLTSSLSLSKRRKAALDPKYILRCQNLRQVCAGLILTPNLHCAF